MLHVESRRVDEVVLTLRGLSGPRAGCVERRAYRDLDDPMRIRWVERWREGRDLRAYLDSEPFRALMGAAGTLAQVEDLRFFQDWPTRRSVGLTDGELE